MTERDGNAVTSPPDHLDTFPAFVDSVRARLEQGRAAYGDASFARPPSELLGELQQEALDLPGWGFVLWRRIEAARLEAAGMEAGATERAFRRPDGPEGRPALADAPMERVAPTGPSADSTDGGKSFEWSDEEWALSGPTEAAVDALARASGLTPGELLSIGVRLVAEQLAHQQARRSRIVVPGRP